MNPKPVLFWPKPHSEIEPRLGLTAADFVVVDTNSIYELQKLSKITHATPIFDPLPRSGSHYQEFKNHIDASDCRFHIVGMKTCRSVSQALRDPSLARASMEELLAATGARTGDRRFRMAADWSRLNWFDTIVAAILVFMASLIGNLLFGGNGLLAAAVAVLCFTPLYVCARIRGSAAGRLRRGHGR